MSKAITASLIGVVGAGGSVTMAYAFGAFDDPAYLAKDLKEFKKAGGGTCAQSLFPGLKLEGELTGNGSKIESTYLTSTGAGASDKAESCLVVNWERDDYSTGESNTKWRGNFRLAGSFKNDKGDKGFVMFAKAKTSDSSQQLNLEGGFYYVTKSSTDNSWSVNKYSELPSDDTNRKKITSSDFSNNFPSVGSSLQNSSKLRNDRKTNGGFVSGSDELSKICADADGCSAKSPISKNWFRGYGTGETKSEGENDLSTGAGNFSTGPESMYEKNSKLDLSSVFTSIKGEWK